MAARGGRNQRGSRDRDGGTFHGGKRNDRGICFAFKNTGRCERISSCPYSHDATSHAGRPCKATRVVESTEQQQARYSYHAWKRLLNEEPTESYTRRRVWEGALRILNEGDQDWTQQVPRDLDEHDKGRIHMKALLNAQINEAPFDETLPTARYFLLALTHPSLLHCLAVDTHVGSLYNFFGGVDGRTAIKFLERVCRALSRIQIDTADSTSVKNVEMALQAMSLAIFELLKRERRVRFNDSILTLVNSIQAVTDSFKTRMDSSSTIRVSRRLDDVRALISRAQDLLADDTVDIGAAFDDRITPFFPRDFVVPSDRHDNDKKDIGDIIIFPTRDEIMSDAKEFLPFTDPDQGHFLEDPVQRHIDTYFRLSRHDTFGELKGALSGVMHTVAQDPNALSNSKLNLGDMRTYQYADAFVSYVKLSSKKGLQAQIVFSQPFSVRGKVAKKANERQKWWEESRRLEPGSLLSLIWIQDGVVQHMFLSVSDKITNPGTEFGLTDHSHLACITVSLVNHDLPPFRTLMEANLSQARGILLEFPNVMPATFVPILENLQAMQRLNRLPFKEWIVPKKADASLQVKTVFDVPPPLYARSAGFKFPLEDLTKTKGVPFHLDPHALCDDEALLDKLEAKTELDRGQCRALVAALMREFAFVQGPPGTGKSYIGLQLMKVLLAVAKKADLGPILIVCYTNHALDQFLEHLLAIGVEKVIRMGGQSKSLKLRDHNLRNISRSEDKTKSEKYMAATSYAALDQCEKESKSVLSALRAIQKRADWNSLSYHIRELYPRIHSQFGQVDDEGFETAGRHPFDKWKSEGSDSTQAFAASTTSLPLIVQNASTSVHSLNRQEREILLDHWIKQAQQDKIGELFEIVRDVAKTREKLGNIHDESDRRILQEAQVIGVTTSGLARRISVLQNVKCKVVICEEAGEVMEPHLLTALLPDVEHCIQIGDHEQLRPSVNNFRDLSSESERGKLHALDKSQFERLSVGSPGRPAMPVAQLNVQRRMRPQISTLIRETIYEKLVDHQSTFDLPDVVGLRHNVFWLDHQNFENGKEMEIQHAKSKSNAWEVEMVHALVRHIVRQGVYGSEDIAVLTPYTGQLQQLRSTMRSSFEVVLSDRDQDALEKDGFVVGASTDASKKTPASQDHRKRPLEKKNFSELLRLATVDNFQGEEAKVIIVSLVRSNEKRNVGFLKTTNRINVLLSRAQHGMYLIGNADTYSSVNMWQKVINMLRANDSIGSSLALCCPRHPNTAIQVQQPDDFSQWSPEGGCREACVDRLECGHKCQARCHSVAMHEAFLCEQPCQRRHHPCDHPCQKSTCGVSCGHCKVQLDNVKLPCGHIKNSVECHLTLNLPRIFCNVKVSKRVSGCGHTIIVCCSEDVTLSNFKCPTPCKTLLPCSHDCSGTCGRCTIKDKDNQVIAKHIACTKKCGRKMGTCNHNCIRFCHDGDCGLCQQPCEVRCKHNRCPQRCHEPCAPCVEPCVWSCEHQGDCKMPCSAPCDRLPCDERCNKLLPCGHQCPSICGETCPVDCCQQCGTKLEEQPDMIMMTPYADLDLNESPIIVLSCGHFFTTETLDGHVGLRDVYTQDPMTGRFTSLIENAELAVSVPQCPHCRGPIKQYVTQRYNRVINRAVIDEMSKRFIVNGQQELQQMAEILSKVESDLNKSRNILLPAFPIYLDNEEVSNTVVRGMSREIAGRYKELVLLLNDIKAIQIRMAMHHQPASKLHQAILYGMSHNSSLDFVMDKLSIDSSAASVKRSGDLRVTLGAQLLEIKIQALLLEDEFDIADRVQSKCPNSTISLRFWDGAPAEKTNAFLESCKQLMEDCIAATLPKIAVETALHYARIVQLFGSSGLADDEAQLRAKPYRNTANELLQKAEQLCEHKFRDRDTLLKAIVRATKMMSREFYEAVSKEELEAIKNAMVSGQGGIATHSGHWYNCVNGHPFAVGECGLPMEQARCPECGEAVGGRDHAPSDGVTRATNMED